MSRLDLLRSIAATIADYRAGEIPPPTPDHVDRWVRQFDAAVQEPLLAEVDHVLKQSYLSRQYFTQFLQGLVRMRHIPALRSFWHDLGAALTALAGAFSRARAAAAGPHTPWKHAAFLDCQRHGSSQREMLALFESLLKAEHGLTLPRGGHSVRTYVYLDDILFTGNRIIADLRHWIETTAPRRARVLVVVIACYRRGLLYTHKTLLQAAARAGKRLTVSWLRGREFEDRPWCPIDGLFPAELPDHPLVRAYGEHLVEAGYPVRLRSRGQAGSSRLFSSEAGRHLLEQQFLLAGLRIRAFCANPQEVMRPLGYDSLNSLGFGATLVTYRNCPNNCPLAWWWGDPGEPDPDRRADELRQPQPQERPGHPAL